MDKQHNVFVIYGGRSSGKTTHAFDIFKEKNVKMIVSFSNYLDLQDFMPTHFCHQARRVNCNFIDKIITSQKKIMKLKKNRRLGILIDCIKWNSDILEDCAELFCDSRHLDIIFIINVLTDERPGYDEYTSFNFDYNKIDMRDNIDKIIIMPYTTKETIDRINNDFKSFNNRFKNIILIHS